MIFLLNIILKISLQLTDIEKKSAFHIVNKVVAKTSRLTARKISLCKQNEVRNIES